VGLAAEENASKNNDPLKEWMQFILNIKHLC
jgi:hypothetical protein